MRKQTTLSRVQDAVVNWDEQLALEHLDGATELRILLCRPKNSGDRSSSIVAACGIYMRDIMEAVPIDKYFELFKPGHGAEGGFIRIYMNYLRPDQVRNPSSLLSDKKGIGFIPKLLLSAAVLAGGAVAVKAYQDKKQSSDEKNDEKKKNNGWNKK